jgi:MFS family permease
MLFCRALFVSSSPTLKGRLAVRRMRWHDYITYNIYWLGLNMATGSLTPIILPFLVAQFVGPTLKGTYLGMLRSAGLVVAILVQPMAGALSDRSTLRWGRRRPFIFVGTMLDLVFLLVIAIAGNYWLLFAAVLLLQFSSNLAHGALQGIIPDLVPEEQRGRASGVKAIMELLPVILVGFTAGPMVGAGNVWGAILLVIVSLFVTMIITMLAVHEQPQQETVEEPLWPPMARLRELVRGGEWHGAWESMQSSPMVRIITLTVIFIAVTTLFGGLVGVTGRLLSGRGTLQLVAVAVAGLVAMAAAIILGVWWSARVGIGDGARKHSSFVWWVVNRLLFLSAVGSIQSFAQYFLEDVVGVPNAPAATSRLLMVVGLFTVGSALPSGWLSDRFGRRSMVAMAGALAAASVLLLFLSRDMTMVTIAGLIIGLSAGMFMTVNWALGTDLVPPGDAGLYLGISNLAGAGAGIVGAGIGGPMADFYNAYQPGLGYLVIFGIYGALFLLAVLTLFKVRVE